MSVNSCSVTPVTFNLPCRAPPAGASSQSKIRSRKNQATMATPKNAKPTLMILDRSSSRCSIRVMRISSRGPREREGVSGDQPCVTKEPVRGLAMLLLGLIGLNGSIFLQLGLVVMLALACFELLFVLLRFLFLLLVLDLTLLRALLELAHAAAEAAGKLGNALRPEEQEYDDKTNDQLWHSDRSKHLSS